MENEINIEQIMEEIRQTIKDRGYDREPLSFEEVELSKPVLQSLDSYDPDEFMHELDYLNHNWNNSWHVPVNGTNPVSVWVKKGIRKCTRFLLFPIVNFQNAYNASAIRCFNQIREYMAELEEYKKKIEMLEKELEEMKTRT